MPAPKGNKQKTYTSEETKEVYRKTAESFKRLGKTLRKLQTD